MKNIIIVLSLVFLAIMILVIVVNVICPACECEPIIVKKEIIVEREVEVVNKTPLETKVEKCINEKGSPYFDWENKFYCFKSAREY